MNSFANAGPGDMLGLTSSESYATAVRGTCYGFSAAIGKVGAVLGTQAFKPIQDNLGKRWTFVGCSSTCRIRRSFLLDHCGYLWFGRYDRNLVLYS